MPLIIKLLITFLSGQRWLTLETHCDYSRLCVRSVCGPAGRAVTLADLPLSRRVSHCKGDDTELVSRRLKVMKT